MRIELLGPSGVGKTTILRESAGFRERDGWSAPQDLPAPRAASPAAAHRAALDRPELVGFSRWCVDLVASSAMKPSRKLAALGMLSRSCFEAERVEQLAEDSTIVHDELLLHRGFSILPHVHDDGTSARQYFARVPLPDAAVVVTADPVTVRRRVLERGTQQNVYCDLSEIELVRLLEHSARVAEIAADVLAARGIPVLVIDAGSPPEESAAALSRFVVQVDRSEGGKSDAGLRERLVATAGSFKKKSGRHIMRTQGIAYCAFDTPAFSVPASSAQRDAAVRVERFGLTAERVRGRTVLDLGSNAGAMLLQLSNLEPSGALGIEYDHDKVNVANDIATYAMLPGVQFRQGDIDNLDAHEIGKYDIVLALAIEAHVLDRDRLYTLLGHVARDLLCFEGNAGCDTDHVKAQLAAVGFTDFVDLGFCGDDRDPRNNRRPLLAARRQAPEVGRQG